MLLSRQHQRLPAASRKLLRVPAKQQLNTPSLVLVRVLCCCSVVNVVGATNSHTKRVKLGEACDVTNDCTLYPGCTVGKGAVLGERCRVFGAEQVCHCQQLTGELSVQSATEPASQFKHQQDTLRQQLPSTATTLLRLVLSACCFRCCCRRLHVRRP